MTSIKKIKIITFIIIKKQQNPIFAGFLKLKNDTE
ncbi:hypothetical protein J2X31_001993 [Flavobacterium arsenatis]|uniref:Uncharacterized protein n=1 Tax=Flavobacterium arsenatis TaxID=1484332 RepID=A0ABU1TPV9_9FLAO|nr:hypothetical protein [Flavobacterium arsenatis]